MFYDNYKRSLIIKYVIYRLFVFPYDNNFRTNLPENSALNMPQTSHVTKQVETNFVDVLLIFVFHFADFRCEVKKIIIGLTKLISEGKSEFVKNNRMSSAQEVCISILYNNCFNK